MLTAAPPSDGVHDATYPTVSGEPSAPGTNATETVPSPAFTDVTVRAPGGEPGGEPGGGGDAKVNCPIESVPLLVNHNAPSDPAAMSSGAEIVGSAKFVIAPPVVMRPIEALFLLVNQSAPSGPTVMPTGLTTVGSAKLVTTPPVVMRPIESMPSLVNHSAPSGPA